jgi:uncharacterized YigZ family protein
MLDSYRCARDEAVIEFVVNKSRFIGYCFPVQTEQQALEKLEIIRKKHWDATHNCYAYSIGERGDIARFSDDGEPSGTAGMPMMEVIRQRGITNVLVIATRYFGGILLGAGGLVRAYSKTTAEALSAAGVLVMKRTAFYALEVEYSLWGKIESFLRAGGYGTYALEFAECVRVTALVSWEQREKFEKDCIELTDGRILPKETEERFWAWPES